MPEDPKPGVPAKKLWSNPALRAMGIPRISLPSRNWMIFWTVVAGLGGGIAYDKYEQSKIREKWMTEVQALSQETYTTQRIPRKLTIFIAPPPNDFLEESLKVFRKYIKPVLNASAIDYQIYTETRQGDIRMAVANKIRELRKEKINQTTENEQQLATAAYNKSWGKFFKVTVPEFFTKPFKKHEPEDESALIKQRNELYTPKDVLGLYRVVDPIEVVKDDTVDLVDAGGVICIGRGAYKEYMTGLHEGLLGPLEKPQALIDEEKAAAEEKQRELDEKIKNGENTNDEDEDSKKEPVVKPYITPEQYENASLPSEFDFSSTVKDKDGVPVLFEQPVYVFPVPNLLGFSTIPRKIYRYYTKRFLADDYGFKSTAVVFNKSRPFKYKDSLFAKEEEVDWSKSWVEKGKERNSEWVQDLVVDERISSRMRVYDETMM